MMEDIHIADGIAVKLLLAGIVLAGGVTGGLGLAAGSSQAAAGGLADDSFAAAFPIDNFSASVGVQVLSLDGKGNDPYTWAAFPINNVTLTQVPGAVLPGVSRVTQSVEPYAMAFGQDMDPYALALSQDMDP